MIPKLTTLVITSLTLMIIIAVVTLEIVGSRKQTSMPTDPPWNTSWTTTLMVTSRGVWQCPYQGERPTRIEEECTLIRVAASVPDLPTPTDLHIVMTDECRARFREALVQAQGSLQRYQEIIVGDPLIIFPDRALGARIESVLRECS